MKQIKRLLLTTKGAAMLRAYWSSRRVIATGLMPELIQICTAPYDAHRAFRVYPSIWMFATTPVSSRFDLHFIADILAVLRPRQEIYLLKGEYQSQPEISLVRVDDEMWQQEGKQLHSPRASAINAPLLLSATIVARGTVQNLTPTIAMCAQYMFGALWPRDIPAPTAPQPAVGVSSPAATIGEADV